MLSLRYSATIFDDSQRIDNAFLIYYETHLTTNKIKSDPGTLRGDRKTRIQNYDSKVVSTNEHRREEYYSYPSISWTKIKLMIGRF